MVTVHVLEVALQGLLRLALRIDLPLLQVLVDLLQLSLEFIDEFLAVGVAGVIVLAAVEVLEDGFIVA